MDRALFASRFRKVCQQALADARMRARETFPDEMRFRVRFRGAYEGPSSANFPAPSKDETRVFPDDTDAQMAGRLLAPLRALTSLSLRGTASVGDSLAEELVARWPLGTLNVQDTAVSEACEERLRARYPSMRLC